jgi:membrane protease subunit HflK
VRAVDVGFVRETYVVDPDDPNTFGGVQGEVLDPARDLEAEAEVMTGEEGLLSLSYTVHYRVRDAFGFQFRIADPEELVRAYSEAALRQVVALESTEDVLLAHRDRIERSTQQLMQAELDAASMGLDIRAVALLDIHAPVNIHFAFRDVASALEDQQRKVTDAEGYQFETLAIARADAHLLEQEAGSYQTRKVEIAKGQAEAFESRLEAFRESRDITHLRLYLDAQEKALEKARVIYLLGEDIEVDLMNVKTERAPLLPLPER